MMRWRLGGVTSALCEWASSDSVEYPMQVRVCAHLYVLLPALSPAGRSQHLWPCHASSAPAQHQDRGPFVVASHTTSSPPISNQGVVKHAPEATSKCQRFVAMLVAAAHTGLGTSSRDTLVGCCLAVRSAQRCCDGT